MNLKNLIEEFMDLVAVDKVEIYNEFSLQHELGIFLRGKLKGYKVQFERNTKYFGITGTTKHEIDIVVYNDTEKYAIELKYPLNGQYPEQMFSFVKDIKFMEELKAAGFDGTYCLTLVGDKCFYSGQKQDGIYAYFRCQEPIQGEIRKPTGKKDEMVQVVGKYKISWRECENHKFYLLKME